MTRQYNTSHHNKKPSRASNPGRFRNGSLETNFASRLILGNLEATEFGAIAADSLASSSLLQKTLQGLVVNLALIVVDC